MAGCARQLRVLALAASPNPYLREESAKSLWQLHHAKALPTALATTGKTTDAMRWYWSTMSFLVEDDNGHSSQDR